VRRRNLVSACGCGLGLGLFGLQAQAQASVTTPPYQLPERLEKPDIHSDEGGLWGLMDREETKLKRSRLVIKDEALNAYVRAIVCKLGGTHCADVRVYIVRNPIFNANMAPNGMMQVWSGLLLRASNEAQLASVLSHEIGHYLARHSVQKLRDMKSRAAFGTFISMFGLVGALGGLAVMAGAYSYSREHESEADQIGIDLLAHAGYAPTEAAIIWQNLLEEIKANRLANNEVTQSSVLFATHPPSEERQSALAARASSVWSHLSSAELGTDAYQKIVGPYRYEFAVDDIKRRRFAESEALYKRLIASDPKDWDAHFFLGEVYRTRSLESDVPLAMQCYETAAQSIAPAPDLFRSRGLVFRQAGRKEDAVVQLASYLKLKPQAEDSALIEQYLKEMQ
jgi:beta-barrel assembly-enhancing protease